MSTQSPSKREELIQHYGMNLAHQALWSPDTIRQIADCALACCHAEQKPIPIKCSDCRQPIMATVYYHEERPICGICLCGKEEKGDAP